MDQGTTESASAVIGHLAVVDLQQFCSADGDEIRRYILAPFSRGQFTYATNGAVAVRVARRDDVGELEDSRPADTLDRYFVPLDGAIFREITIDVPSDVEVERRTACDECEGRGKYHNCPECTCTCDGCGGKGFVSTTERISVDAFGGFFRLPLLRMLLGLPGVEVADYKFRSGDPRLFRFDGGVAAIMPCRTPLDRHMLASPRKDPSIT